MWLRSISLTARISALMLVVLAAFVAMGFASINSVRDNIYDERKRSISSVVDSALSIVDGFYSRYQSGELSEFEAQRQAKEVLRSLRFEGENYVWINDMQSNMVMHPTNPELEGTSVASMEDVAGLRVFPEFVRIVQTQDSGYVEYLWPVEGQDEPDAKISFVKGFEPWNWVLGTGVWVNDLEQAVNDALVTILVQAAVFVGIIGLIGYLLIHSISDPIRKMARAGNAIVQNGQIDLRHRFNEDGNDELTRLGRSMNTVFQKIEETLHQVITSQSIVTNTTNVVSNTVNQTNQSLTYQQQQMDRLTQAMQEMRSTVEAVSHNTDTAVEMSSEANDEANSGSVVVKNSVAEIKQLYDTMQQTKASMETLAEDVASIDSVLDVIISIAEQTNLLALNAAIEAARAGEQGRGFAVVADEVRGLAQRTQQSTQEIQDIIQRLKDGATDSVNHMTASAEKAEAATEYSTNAGHAFDKIRLRISEMDTNTDLIATAAKGQANTSQQIDDAVTAIREAMAPVRDSMSRTEESAGQLSRAVDEVQGAVRNIVLKS